MAALHRIVGDPRHESAWDNADVRRRLGTSVTCTSPGSRGCGHGWRSRMPGAPARVLSCYPERRTDVARSQSVRPRAARAWTPPSATRERDQRDGLGLRGRARGRRARTQASTRAPDAPASASGKALALAFCTPAGLGRRLSQPTLPEVRLGANLTARRARCSLSRRPGTAARIPATFPSRPTAPLRIRCREGRRSVRPGTGIRAPAVSSTRSRERQRRRCGLAAHRALGQHRCARYDLAGRVDPAQDREETP
jgi:hypothetical protein